MVLGIQRTLRALVQSGRLWRFAAVGVVGTACDFAVLIGLVELASFPPEAGKIVGAETAVIVMFVLNERWTFRTWGTNDRRALLRRLVTSNLVRLGGMAVAVTVLSILVRNYGFSYVLANAVGIACGFVVNYTFENLLTWRTHR